MRVSKLSLPGFVGILFLVTCLPVNRLYSQSLSISVTTTDPSCGGSNGSILITPTGGTAPYTYSRYGNVQNTGYYGSLIAGTYTFDITDAVGAIKTITVTLTDTKQPPKLTVTSWNNPSVCNARDGSVTLSASGGVPPYEYGLDLNNNYQTSNVIANMANGIYKLYVRDATGCVGSADITLRDNCPFAIYAYTYNYLIFCNQTGWLSINGVFGGTPPYEYSIGGVIYQSSNEFKNLAPGIHYVYVRDATGFAKMMAVQMIDVCVPEITYAAVDAACMQNNGSLTITVNGVNPPYNYTIDGINYQAANIFTGLASGYYTVTIRDALNRTFSKVATVNDNCPQLSLSATAETCQGNDGTVTATVIKGTPPYQYSTDGVNFQANSVFTGLYAGDHTITVKDASGFTSTATVAVNNACINVSAAATNSTCGNSNGGIVVSASNGTAPYQYSLDGTNFQPGNSFTAVAAGPYTVWARDAAGKINNTTITVNNIAGPQINATATPALCTNKEGTISVSAAGGTTPYQFSIDNSTTFSNNNVFNGISGGNYVAAVKDANGCLATQAVVVAISDNLTFNAGAQPTICEGTATVFTCTSNGSSFNWSPSANLSNPSILNPAASPGVTTKYYVTASLGVCTKKDSVTVFINPAPVADAGNGSTICYGQNARLNGAGGVSYNWAPVTWLSDAAIANPDAVRPSSTISYTLTVTDGNGCKSIQPSTVTISVTPPSKVFAGNDTSIVLNQPFFLQAKDVNNSGFTEYVWSPSYGLNNSATQNPVALPDRNMTYTVTATTPQGCSGTDEINIKVYKGPEIYVPNAFSPNSDGRNDVLRVITVGIKEFKYFNIYNRWGQLIFSTKDPSRGWSGETGNVQQTSGTFVWMAEGVDGYGNTVRRKGTVTLIR